MLQSRKFTTSLFTITLFMTAMAFPTQATETKIVQPATSPGITFSVLSANVGNLSIGCMDVLNKLCYQDVEERITSNIKVLNPDIVALQEVLAPWQCENIKTNNRNKVCYKEQLVPQVRRLLGSNYTIACTDREKSQFECIAVKTSVGEIMGCKPGEICNVARTGKEVDIDACDNGFTVSVATVKLNNGFVFDLANFHPQSTDTACRGKMIARVFEGEGGNEALLQQQNVLLMGDFNLDPWRDQNESVEIWNKYFSTGWGGRPFTYHSGIVEKDPPYFTSFVFYRKRSVDFIASNFAEGACLVLGESPNTSRLDGGKGTDHRAIFGSLTIQP